MKSSCLFYYVSQALLIASGVLAQGSIPDISETTCGITLLASENSKFTKLTGGFGFDDGINSGEGENPGVEWVTQFVAVDLFPVPFGPFGEIPPPLPPICPDFLQVGVNITAFFPAPEENFNPSSIFAYAFYVWNNITTNITDENGNLVQFVSGDTVDITILPSEDGANATVLYNSTVNGLIQLDLTGGSLCLDSVQWAFGSAIEQEAIYGVADFVRSTSTQRDLTTGEIQVLGPDSGDRTLIWSDVEGIYYEAWQTNSEGFNWDAEPDDPTY